MKEATPSPQRRRRRVLRLGLLAGLMLILAGGALIVKQNWDERAREARLAFASEIAELERAFEAVPVLTEDEERLLRRSRNAVHVALAETLGVEPPTTRAGVDSVGLVPLAQEGDAYVVQEMSYGAPHLTADATALLDSIATRFQAKLDDLGLPAYAFTVSSAVRSLEDQAALRGVNVNAASGISSHSYGTTFDITFERYAYAGPERPEVDLPTDVPGPLRDGLARELSRELADARSRFAASYRSRLKALLGRTLIEMENDGLLVTVMERRQPVYHTTVAQRLTQPEPTPPAAAPRRTTPATPPLTPPVAAP